MLPAGQDEPASVVAARQLAEEARHRRPGQRRRAGRPRRTAVEHAADVREPGPSTR